MVTHDGPTASADPAPTGATVEPASVVAGLDAVEHLLKVARLCACGRHPQDAAAYLAMARDRLDTLIS